MKSPKTDIVTSRLLPREKLRLQNVAENTRISTSYIVRMSLNDFLNRHGVTDGSNPETYKDSVLAEYHTYRQEEWEMETDPMADDHQDKIIRSLKQTIEVCECQLKRMLTEKTYEDSRRLEKLERDSEDLFSD